MPPSPNEPRPHSEAPNQAMALPVDWEQLPANALDLHALFRLSPATPEASKHRQHLLVKKLSEPNPYFLTIGELSEFFDDRVYEHSNEAINQLSQFAGIELQKLLIKNGSLRIETGISLEHLPSKNASGRIVHTIVYDKPSIKDVLKGENRSNLTLFAFKLLHIHHHSAPLTLQFKIICDNLKPKFRTIDYGLLLNHFHQPCGEQLTPQERYDFYAHSLKSAAVLLHYLMTHQATQSVRYLHDVYYHFFCENINMDALLGKQDKIQLLKLADLCYAYTRLVDKHIKASN